MFLWGGRWKLDEREEMSMEVLRGVRSEVREVRVELGGMGIFGRGVWDRMVLVLKEWGERVWMEMLVWV